ncbi:MULTISPECIES: LysR family transcriptional regulator [unclassified Psychrobacter]|uniref:LysR family transcriptional regulator n=1 Tax=unclassified Psychrobacter TaxID=196806 RepID=UPI0018F6090A|nr:MULTISPECIES: LysR family transcriptional regulator [unclassified Psychrobacter]
MDIKQLQAFVAIAELQSFSAAAQKIGLSQPSLSRLLKQLEADMGVLLVARQHRPLQLTEAGAFFYKKIATLLIEMQTITSMTQRLASPSPELRIGFVPSVLYGLLPEVIATLKQQHTDIEVRLCDISSYQQMQALKSGEIDVGFGRFFYQDAWTQQILLRHERYVVALPKAHPAAQIPYQRLSELAQQHLILYHKTHLPIRQALSKSASNHAEPPITEPLLYIFAQHGVTPLMTTEVSDLQVALGLVAAGEGVTLVPASLQTVRTEQIAYQPLWHENVTSPVYLHTLKDRPHPRVADLLAAVYAVYEQHGITYRRQSFGE